MITLKGKPYINLDSFLPLDNMPDVKEAIIESYKLIRFSNPITQFDVNGKGMGVKYPVTSDKTHEEAWTREMRTGICGAPYAFLFLREGKKSNNKEFPWIYDSIIDSDDIWNSFDWVTEKEGRFRSLSVWEPFINWAETLPLKKMGLVYFFLQRPYIIPYHHQDHLMDEPYPHRQEFIRIGINEKHFHILNVPNDPVEVDCKSSFFNQQNLHGSDQYSTEWTISVRIDCVFTDEFREQIGIGDLDQY